MRLNYLQVYELLASLDDCKESDRSTFNIQIGWCAVVEDPWGNPLVLLDITKVLFASDADGNIIGNVEL